VFDHFGQGVGQKLQGPPNTSFRRSRASQGEQLRFFLSTQLSARTRSLLFTERRLQAHLHKGLLDAINGRAAGLHSCCDGLVGDATIRCQQDLHPSEPSHGLLTAAHQSAKLASFGLAKIDPIPYIHCLSPYFCWKSLG